MANSSNFGTSNSNIVYWIEYYTNSQNIPNNTSNITAKVWVKRTNTGYTTYGSGTVNLNINGTNYSQEITSSQRITSSPICLIEKTIDIPHNADGTKVVRIEASISHSQFSSGTNGLNYTLSTIARKSSVTCADGNIESSTTININRASSSFTHTLKYDFGDLTGTIATKTTNTSVGWTIPKDFYAQIPNATNGTGTITCETYSGNTLIGSSTCTFHAFVINSNPSVSATVVDVNATTKALTGDENKLIKYYSNAKVTITATAKNSATIKSQKVVCGAKSATTASSTLNNVETGIFDVSCMDSRGLTASARITKTLVDYIRLAFTQVTLSRPSTTSDTVNAVVKGNYFNASFGAVANTLTLKWRWRIKNGTWSSYTTVTATKNGNTFSYSASLGTNFSFSNEYEFEFVATDKLATVTSAKTVTRGLPILDIGKDDVKANGTIYQFDKEVLTNEANAMLKALLLSICYPVGSIKISTSSANPSTYIGGTWVAWGKGRVPVGIDTADNDFKTIEKTGGSKTHTLTVEEMPSHNHSFSYEGTNKNPMVDTGLSGNEWGVHFETKNEFRASPASMNNTGGSKAHNNLQPYIVCYMWKRTA